MAGISLEAEAVYRVKQEHADIAVKTFALSQMLNEKWFTAEGAAKRWLLEIVCLNYTLGDGSFVNELRKPFDLFVKGLDSPNSRGDRI